MRLRWVGAIVIAGVLLVSATCVGAVFALGISEAEFASGERIAVVQVHGQIMTRQSDALFATDGASAERIIEQLEQIQDDSSIQAVMLDIDSPGGGVVASEQIHNEIVEVVDAGIPVVAYMGDTAASGGYYIAAPANRIVANAATVTGSIGVISQIPNLQELYDKIGVDMQVITTGEHKDMLQTTRPLSDEEREIMQDYLDQTYQRFVEVVAQGRDMGTAEVEELADGRIYSGQQASENGLVDDLGDYQDAISITGEMAGLGSDPEVQELTPAPPGLFDLLTGVMSGDLDLPLPFDFETDPRDLYLEVNYLMQ